MPMLHSYDERHHRSSHPGYRESIVKNQLWAAVAVVAIGLGSAPPRLAEATSNDEMAEFRSQLQSLMQRMDRLESENASLKAEKGQLKALTEQLAAKQSVEPNKQTPPAAQAAAAAKPADWPSRITMKGDIRY